MNKSLVIVLIPAILVAAGYLVVMKMMHQSPPYARLAGAMAGFFGLIYLLSRKSGKKAKSTAPSTPNP